MQSIKIQHQNRLNIRSKICMHDESGVEKKTRRNAKKYERKFIYTLWMTTKLNTLTLTLAHSHNPDFSWNVYSHVLWCMCGIYSFEFVAVLFSLMQKFARFSCVFPISIRHFFSCVCFFFKRTRIVRLKVKWHTHIDMEIWSHFIDIDVVVVVVNCQMESISDLHVVFFYNGNQSIFFAISIPRYGWSILLPWKLDILFFFHIFYPLSHARNYIRWFNIDNFAVR